jgi:hypothetical protein
MSEPRLNHFLPDVEEALTKARDALKAAAWCCDTCHRSVSDALRPYLAGGQPPSDGMPSEPSEEAIAAACYAWNHSTHSNPKYILRDALIAAYAADDVLRVLASEAYWREKAERLEENSE